MGGGFLTSLGIQSRTDKQDLIKVKGTRMTMTSMRRESIYPVGTELCAVPPEFIPQYRKSAYQKE